MSKRTQSGSQRAIIAVVAVLVILAGGWFFVLSPMLNAGNTSNENCNVATTQDGTYTITVTPSLDPIEINQTHNWIVKIESADGMPVENAVIEISGHMPAHQHGLPTAPQVTEYLGNGEYQIEGMEFQMPGDWVVTLVFNIGDKRESVQFQFNLNA